MQEILVLPRDGFNGLDGFIEWSRACRLVDSVAECAKWIPRTEAEISDQWVQPIPCAVFRDSRRRYCLFRQARQQRPDLSHRLSLVIGGHIDSECEFESIHQIFENTVYREVSEEVGIHLSCPLKPIGMVIDATSLRASRHIGFIYEVVVDEEVKSLSSAEFSVRSKYNGQFFSRESLSEKSSHLDPWSYVLFHQFLNDGFPMDIGRQSKFLVPLE